LAGKDGETYHLHGGLCLETQNFPDFVHHANFPPGILYPGQRYQHLLELRLTTV
jgi:aldose 1-epimerase